MKILAVDDDPIILELLSELLASFGEHEMTTALCAAEALDELSKTPTPFDCFLLDIQMPGIDGIQLCEILRDIPVYARAPIVMITAMSDKRYIDAAFSAGATDYVNKPFDIMELHGRINVIESIVAERRGRTDKIFAVKQAGKAQPRKQHIDLHEPVAINEVDGVIEYFALENYLTQLSRGAMFGSTVFAFNIRGIEKLHRETTSFEFQGLIADVSEAISESLKPHQFLISYAGNGTFACVTEGGWKPDMKLLTSEIDWTLSQMDLHRNGGEPLTIRVCAGHPVRLIWRSGQGAMDALIEAHASAEEASIKLEKELDHIWFLGETA
ncbi:response regulator [Pseudogemmobacter sp. W21_MBD1_M6]|uniref:response regulator n=1 Tax=Pseudogemmobacter sp. W21_MBD1_M6 TaxID=3240271 RepID=UPI003F9741AB